MWSWCYSAAEKKPASMAGAETQSPRRGRGACGGRGASRGRGERSGPARTSKTSAVVREVRSVRGSAGGGADAFGARAGTKTGEQEIFYGSPSRLLFSSSRLDHPQRTRNVRGRAGSGRPALSGLNRRHTRTFVLSRAWTGPTGPTGHRRIRGNLVVPASSPHPFFSLLSSPCADAQ